MSGVFLNPTVTGSGSAPIGAAGGELSGTYPNPEVIIINGASVPDSGSVPVGNVLQIFSTDELGYGPIVLDGGHNFVTGVLPADNVPLATTTHLGLITLAGDLGGTNAFPTVLSINGTTVPSGPTVRQVLIATSSISATWDLIKDASVAPDANIDATKILYTDSVSPPLNAINVQTAIDSVKATIVSATANGIQKQTQNITTGNLTASGGVLTNTFNVGGALPTNARVLGAEINVTQGLAASLLSSAIVSVQGSTDTIGSLVDGVSILSTGLLGGGNNPYLSRGGQQITAKVTLIGAFLNALTAGAFTVNVFYAIIP